MRTSIARIGRVTLKASPAVSVIPQQNGTPAADHLQKAVRQLAYWERGSMAGYALVVWDGEMGWHAHYHIGDSPFGGTAMCTFVHDALLKLWIEAQK